MIFHTAHCWQLIAVLWCFLQLISVPCFSLLLLVSWLLLQLLLLAASLTHNTCATEQCTQYSSLKYSPFSTACSSYNSQATLTLDNLLSQHDWEGSIGVGWGCLPRVHREYGDERVLSVCKPAVLWCSLLNIAVLWCSLLIIVVLCCSLLSIVVLCCSLLGIVGFCCSLQFIVVICCSAYS